MGQFYLGGTQINGLWLGNTQINSITEPILIPKNGLAALYNVAYSRGFNDSVITDLSGNGNDLLLGGYYQYVSSSILFPYTNGQTGSLGYAYTSQNISSNLSGSNKDLTVIIARKSAPVARSENWTSTWYLGPLDPDWNTASQITDFSYFGTYGTSVQFNMVSDYYNDNTHQLFSSGSAYGISWRQEGTGGNTQRWNYTAFQRAANSSSFGNNTNIRIATEGWTETDSTGTNTGTWNTSYISAATASASAPPRSTNYIFTPDNQMEMDLPQTRFVINPFSRQNPFIPNPDRLSIGNEFLFGGAAIYDRILTETEIQQVFDWFQIYYPANS